MSLNPTHHALCPYCWQPLEVEVEAATGPYEMGGEKAEAAGTPYPVEFVEDCHVCCRPIVFTWMGSEGGLQARAENE